MANHRIPTQAELTALAAATAERLGVDLGALSGPATVRSPINGQALASLAWSGAEAVDDAVERARQAFLVWRTVPAPARGALVKRLGELLTEHKDDLATLIGLEV